LAEIGTILRPELIIEDPVIDEVIEEEEVGVLI
jgi:hypothetical protein